MTNDEFWQIIDSVHNDSMGDMDRKCELLRGRLSSLQAADLRAFMDCFDAADTAAYSWPLWGAAYVMHGGCSDDAFMDFRATLISHGRVVYEAALDNPESLTEVDFGDQEDICYEGFQYVMNEVAEEQLGEIPLPVCPLPSEPSGTKWNEDTVDALYPGLAAKYWGAGNNESETKKPWWKFW